MYVCIYTQVYMLCMYVVDKLVAGRLYFLGAMSDQKSCSYVRIYTCVYVYTSLTSSSQAACKDLW